MSDTQQFLTTFGNNVALYLSAGKLWWKLDKVDDTHIKLRGADGMKITLWCGGITYDLQDGKQDKIKFEVRGDYPPDVYVGREDKLTINVSYSRGAKAVANDIERRFLSKYVPLYYEKLKIQREIERGRDARERLLADLARAFDFREVRNSGGHLERVEASYGDGKFNYRGRVDANYTTSLKPVSERRWEVGLKLESLTVDQALRIAGALKEPALPPEQMRLL